MASRKVSLVPSNLVRSPYLWNPQEVKAWLGFCVEEFSLSPVCVDKFAMNGKALCLLRRQDFIERVPHAGDVLFNAFQQLQYQDANTLSVFKPLDIQPSQQSYVPILPHPRAAHNGMVHYVSNGAASKRDDSTTFQIPASLLSPAPTEKYSSDSDSSPNDSASSPKNCDSVDEVRFLTSKPKDASKHVHMLPLDGESRLLWEFIYQLLQDDKYSDMVCWDKESECDLTFRINKPMELANFWGLQKNRRNMTYEKLSRALRYYYKMNIIRKVQGKRLTYEFLQHPTKICKGQRGARPHSLKPPACDPQSPSIETSVSSHRTLAFQHRTSSCENGLEQAPDSRSDNLQSPNGNVGLQDFSGHNDSSNEEDLSASERTKIPMLKFEMDMDCSSPGVLSSHSGNEWAPFPENTPSNAEAVVQTLHSKSQCFSENLKRHELHSYELPSKDRTWEIPTSCECFTTTSHIALPSLSFPALSMNSPFTTSSLPRTVECPNHKAQPMLGYKCYTRHQPDSFPVSHSEGAMSSLKGNVCHTTMNFPESFGKCENINVHVKRIGVKHSSLSSIQDSCQTFSTEPCVLKKEILTEQDEPQDLSMKKNSSGM